MPIARVPHGIRKQLLPTPEAGPQRVQFRVQPVVASAVEAAQPNIGHHSPPLCGLPHIRRHLCTFLPGRGGNPVCTDQTDEPPWETTAENLVQLENLPPGNQPAQMRADYQLAPLGERETRLKIRRMQSAASFANEIFYFFESALDLCGAFVSRTL